jgi:hypothetical protein
MEAFEVDSTVPFEGAARFLDYSELEALAEAEAMASWMDTPAISCTARRRVAAHRLSEND